MNLHAVEDFVAVLQPAQDGDGVLHRRLVHHHGLEPALERGVLFDVFAVFVQRGRADAVQLAAREHRLEQVARVHRALGFARADDGVQLVDEQQNVAVALFHLVEHGLEPFLELAAELGAGDQRAHIEREYGFVLQALRHVAAHDALRQPFGDGGLADARLADEDGVVLRFAREDADDVANLRVAPDDGVQLLLARAGDEVGAVLGQRVVGSLGVVAGHRRALDGREAFIERVARDAVLPEQLGDFGGLVVEDRFHQMFDRDVFVLVGLRLLGGGVQQPVGLGRDVDFIRLASAAGDGGERGDDRVQRR